MDNRLREPADEETPVDPGDVDTEAQVSETRDLTARPVVTAETQRHRVKSP